MQNQTARYKLKPDYALAILFALAALVFAPLATANAGQLKPYVPDFLKKSVFEKVALESGIDALLLYSVAITESAASAGRNLAAPHKYALRSDDLVAYPKNKDEALKTLAEWRKKRTSIDVGLMQINLRWHGHRVDNPNELFNPETNLRVASQILIEAMKSSPFDVVTAIGRYHTWDKIRGEKYANRVLAVYRELKANE